MYSYIMYQTEFELAIPAHSLANCCLYHILMKDLISYRRLHEMSLFYPEFRKLC